jgi:Cof subfamily protein (haloacid dehalogenase superfamily)
MKLMALDIDGTFIDDSFDQNKQYIVSQDNIDACNAFLKEGNAIAFASGRPYSGIMKFARKLIPSPNVYAITSNGACLYKQDGSLVEASFIPYSYFLKMIECFGIEQGNTYMCYLTDGYLGYYGEPNFAPLEAEFNDMPYRQLDHETLDPNTPLEKAFITFKDHKARSVKVPDFFLDKCDAFATSDFFFELVAKGVNKAKAVGDLAKRLGIDHNDIYTFGDGENDFEMVKQFHGTAPSSALESVKQVAEYVSCSASEGAINYALKNYWHLI